MGRLFSAAVPRLPVSASRADADGRLTHCPTLLDALLENIFTKWIKFIKDEFDGPDLWNDLERNTQLFDTFDDSPDEKFSNAEVQAIQAKLRIAAGQVAKSDLPQEAKEQLATVFEHQAVQSESLTKKEWRMNFVSAITSAVVGLALNPTQAHDLFAVIKAAFSGLFLT